MSGLAEMTPELWEKAVSLYTSFPNQHFRIAKRLGSTIEQCEGFWNYGIPGRFPPIKETALARRADRKKPESPPPPIPVRETAADVGEQPHATTPDPTLSNATPAPQTGDQAKPAALVLPAPRSELEKRQEAHERARMLVGEVREEAIALAPGSRKVIKAWNITADMIFERSVKMQRDGIKSYTRLLQHGHSLANFMQKYQQLARGAYELSALVEGAPTQITESRTTNVTATADLDTIVSRMDEIRRRNSESIETHVVERYQGEERGSEP